MQQHVFHVCKWFTSIMEGQSIFIIAFSYCIPLCDNKWSKLNIFSCIPLLCYGNIHVLHNICIVWNKEYWKELYFRYFTPFQVFMSWQYPQFTHIYASYSSLIVPELGESYSEVCDIHARDLQACGCFWTNDPPCA